MNEPTPLQEAVQALREDSALLELALLGAQAAIDPTTQKINPLKPRTCSTP